MIEIIPINFLPTRFPRSTFCIGIILAVSDRDYLDHPGEIPISFLTSHLIVPNTNFLETKSNATLNFARVAGSTGFSLHHLNDTVSSQL
jgi:hypothetical protein